MKGIQLGLLGGVSARADGGTEFPLEDAEPLVLWRRWHHDVMDELMRTIPWELRSIRTAGGQIPNPRMERWYADRVGAIYSYSGNTYRAMSLQQNSLLAMLRTLVNIRTGHAFDAVFANLYRDGDDSIGWHADDEPALGDPMEVRIASLSFGESRPFQLKHRTTNERFSVFLGHGDLLLMGRGVQARYLHQVPKRTAIESPRVNLTFRKLA